MGRHSTDAQPLTFCTGLAVEHTEKLGPTSIVELAQAAVSRALDQAVKARARVTGPCRLRLSHDHPTDGLSSVRALVGVATAEPPDNVDDPAQPVLPGLEGWLP